MLNIIWDTRGYFFWLLIISLFCWILERIVPWRPEQKIFRNQIWHDYFWLIFNGHYAGLLISYLAVWLIYQVNQYLSFINITSLENLNILADSPFWLQFIIYFILADFIEWCVHNLLHRSPWMWEFHKLHHSIIEMDWIGNFRFHWMEIVFYKTIKYFPLVIMGVDDRVILWIAIVATLIGHLNHSNIKVDWGIFKYILNSPRLHIWHHDEILHKKYGQNFAIVFSLWDWIFGTIYYPSDEEQPVKLGFIDIEQFPNGLIQRFVYPILKFKNE